MHAAKDIKKGEEVFVSYGDKGNEVLLDIYGFVQPKNKETSYQFKLTRTFRDANGKEKESSFAYAANKNFQSKSMSELFFFYRAMLSGDKNLFDVKEDSFDMVPLDEHQKLYQQFQALQSAKEIARTEFTCQTDARKSL